MMLDSKKRKKKYVHPSIGWILLCLKLNLVSRYTNLIEYQVLQVFQKSTWFARF